jgi:ribonuclease HII
MYTMRPKYVNKPTLDEENVLWKNGYKYIAGVDEVGRGCFAGPVVSAAVILTPDFDTTIGINDSKLLSPARRDTLSEIIKQNAISYSISVVGVETINRLGIGKAAQESFRQAIDKLKVQPDYILVDAFYINGVAKYKQKPIVHGDRLSISIAAASIIAKVFRDKLMCELHLQYPEYDFARNKGYGTKAHRDAIGRIGLSNLHRSSFDLTEYVTIDRC